MKTWILKELITPKEKEILILTLIAAGYTISTSIFEYNIGIVDGYYISIHKDFDRQVCEDRNIIEKYPVKYKELLFRIREEIKNQVDEDSRRDRCEVGGV